MGDRDDLVDAKLGDADTLVENVIVGIAGSVVQVGSFSISMMHTCFLGFLWAY